MNKKQILTKSEYFLLSFRLTNKLKSKLKKKRFL